MDKYVISFEQAQQLKKAGFPQDTVYKYYQVIVTGEVKLIAGVFKELEIGGKQTRMFAAPLTDEIQQQLPDKINDRYVKLEIRTLAKSVFMPMLVEESLETIDEYFHPDYSEIAWDDDTADRIRTLPNALAELWMWCETQGYSKTAI